MMDEPGEAMARRTANRSVLPAHGAILLHLIGEEGAGSRREAPFCGIRRDDG